MSGPGGSGASDTERIIFEESFEGSINGWGSRGDESISLVSGKGRDGGQVLYVSGRTGTWNGPIKDFTNTMRAGRSYKISVWAMYEEGPESLSLSISTQQDIDGEGSIYSNIGGDTLPMGTWVKMETTVTLPRSEFIVPIKLYFETAYKDDADVTADDLTSFYIDDLSITQLPPAPVPEVEEDIPALRDFIEFPLGSAMDYVNLNSSDDRHGLLRHFDAFVYGNEMKMDATQPVEGQFNFKKGDALIEYAEANGQLVRGHTLLWHSQAPRWFFVDGEGLPSKEVMLERIRTHVSTVADHYKGHIDSWDVVNEAVADDGTLRNSPYLQAVGSEEYIAEAFYAAREADPEAKLFINDYNVSFSGAKQDRLIQLVKDLKGQGVPIDGVGLQMHISLGHPPVSDVETAIERFAALGVEVQVTELDISVYANDQEGAKEADREILLNQANKYKDLFDMFTRQYEKGNLSMVMVWGLDDAHTWKNNHPVQGRPDHPLFFDKQYKAKPAYWIFVDPERLPVNIKNKNAVRVSEAVNSVDAEAWTYATPSPIVDRQGNSYGEFKLLWSDNQLQVRAEILDNTVDEQDKVTLYIEPMNEKGDKPSDSYLTMDFMRSQAEADTGESYTVLATVPVTCRLAAKMGFDLAVFDGQTQHSWNDYENLQAQSSINLGTILFKELPPVAEAKKLDGRLRIDGRMDPVWEEVEPVQIDVETQGYTLPGSQFRTLWDEEYLYVLLEIQDSLLNDSAKDFYEQDSVEIFIDQNNGKTTTYEDDDAQYRVSFRNVPSFNGGSEELFQSKTRVFAGGYMVEVAVPLTHIDPIPGHLMGFDVQINEADDSGARSGIRNWVNDTNMGYQDMSGLGVLILTE